MNADEIAILRERLIPAPQSVTFRDGPDYTIRDGCAVRLELGEPGDAAEKAAARFRQYWGTTPKIAARKEATPRKMPNEAYRVQVTAKSLRIAAKGERGMLHALKTLRQLAEPCRGTATTQGHLLPPCAIADAPAMAFRGIHLCLFPETELWEIEKRLRLAAYHKFNYAVLENWFVFPFRSRPELCLPDRRVSRGELKELIQLGRELGITLIPQLNLLGHAGGGRLIAGKHAVLDFHPELQPLFEPDGWTWCLSNPATRRVLEDLVVEMHEFFDRPPYFHIGCDEAYSFGTCRECRRRALKDLARDHIVHFHDLLKQRGTRTMMWHDMLLEAADPRWKGYVACGAPRHRLGELYRELPPDIIIADWQYGAPAATAAAPMPEWPTMRFFKRQGFSVVACPWRNWADMRNMGKLVRDEGLAGMLATTWHIEDANAFYVTAAGAAWNPDVEMPYSELQLGHHLRQVGWDMGIAAYERAGWFRRQTAMGDHPHGLR